MFVPTATCRHQTPGPAQFDVNYETVSVKRDAMIKFNCAPRGDQPIRIDWFKEGNLLAPAASLIGPNSSTSQPSKYSEIAYLAPSATTLAANSSGAHADPQHHRQRHNNLVLVQSASLPSVQQPPSGDPKAAAAAANQPAHLGDGLLSSELFINYADRADTGAFICVARNAYGKDELTYKLIVQEAPDAPLNLQLQNVQSNSLKLIWTAPFDGNLPISHYVVEHRRVAGPAGPAPTSGEWTRMIAGASSHLLAPTIVAGAEGAPIGNYSQQHGVTIKLLHAKSTYQIRVAAVNAIGQGAYSSPQTVQTAEEPPNVAPNDLRAQPISSSSIKVMWRGPGQADEQAPVRGYYVSHRRLQSGPPAGPGSTPANQLAWLATTSVSAANVSGLTFGGRLLGGAAQQQPAAQGQQQGAGAATNYELLLQMLDKNTKYEIRVQPYNSMGVGPASETVGQTLKFDRPGQPTLRLVAARKQSFELKWSIADDQPLMGFSLFYKCEYDDWQEIQLAVIYHYVVENLRCGNKYQIYLSAFNLVGRSDPSDVLSVRTEGTVPIAPDKSQFFRSNITEVVLDMSGWQSGGCPITSFMIQFKRLHDTNWFILSEGATPFAQLDKITIPDLAPATWYKLMVTALNEAGSTNAEYIFSTLTTSGHPLPASLAADEQRLATRQGHQAGASAAAASVFHSLGQLLFATSSHNGAHDVQLLVPMSCILLLLVTSLASYLYYNQAQAHKSRHAAKQPGANGLHLGRTPSVSMMDRLHCGADSSSSSSSSQTQQQQQQHRLATNCLALARATDKQLIQSSGGLHQMHYLADSGQTMALSAMKPQTGSEQAPSDPMLDSLLGQAGAFKRLTVQTNQTVCQPMAHLLAGATNSSSVSTHSTSCFDGASSSHSSGATTASRLNANQLQPADEPHQQVSCFDEQPASDLHQYLAFDCRQAGSLAARAATSADMAEHQGSPARSAYTGHAELGDDGQQPTNNDQQPAGQRQPVEPSLADYFGSSEHQAQAGNGQLYQQRLLSSSFASAANLLQRQQQHVFYQQHQNEPIYQRLDKFKTCGLPTCKQFATLNPAHKSQTLRFTASNGAGHQVPQFSLDDQFVAALHQQTRQQHQFAPSDGPAHGCQFDERTSFYPGPPAHEQQQQPEQPGDSSAFRTHHHLAPTYEQG